MGLSAVPSAIERCAMSSQRQNAGKHRFNSAASSSASLSCNHKVFTISDVHTDYKENMNWVRRLSCQDYQNHTLIVAGDVSDDLQTFEVTMSLFKERFENVFFVPGNHDLWCRGKQHEKMNSLDKLARLNEVCSSSCIDTKPRRVNTVWIVPLLSWYHQSFDKDMDIVGYHIPSLEKICVDFRACRWPPELKHSDLDVAAYVDGLNSDTEPLLDEVRDSDDQVISFSHFLPRPELCPEKRMLLYPHLPKIVGSDFLERRLRSIHGCQGNERACHVFGHTHFSWDATIDGIRYIQAPLGYPRERYRRAKWGQPLLPLCIFDQEAGGLISGPLPCYWSDYYRHNERDPSNIVLAPWVAKLYHRS